MNHCRLKQPLLAVLKFYRRFNVKKILLVAAIILVLGILYFSVADINFGKGVDLISEVNFNLNRDVSLGV